MFKIFSSISVIAFIIFSDYANALTSVENTSNTKKWSINIGTDLYLFDYGQSRYSYDKYDVIKNPLSQISRVSVGVSYNLIDNWYIGYRTNRLVNKEFDRTAYDSETNSNVSISTKFVSDSIFVGYRIHQRILYFVSASYSTVNYSVKDSNNYTKSSSFKTTFYSTGFSYSISKHFSTSILYIFPNKTLNLNKAFGCSLNLSF